MIPRQPFEFELFHSVEEAREKYGSTIIRLKHQLQEPVKLTPSQDNVVVNSSPRVIMITFYLTKIPDKELYYYEREVFNHR